MANKIDTHQMANMEMLQWIHIKLKEIQMDLERVRKVVEVRLP